MPYKMGYVLDAAVGDPPADEAPEAERNAYQTRLDDSTIVQSGMLYAMEPDLQKRYEHMSAFEVITELKANFEPQARAERYEASNLFFSASMEEHSSVAEHVVKMSGYVARLNSLGCQIPDDLATDRVLQSLPPSYKGFIMNYNMQGMNKTLQELFSMLKQAEVEIKKENLVLAVTKTTDFKKSGKKARGKGKSKGNKQVAATSEAPKPKAKAGVKCFYCKGDGHWKRNCTKYLADKKAGKIAAPEKGICDIHIIDVYLTSARSDTWVFDTGSVAHICNSQDELQNRRRLTRDEVTLRVGNGQRVDVLAVGTLRLRLPSGLLLVLNKCYFVPRLSMNIVSGSCLMRDRYSFKSENNGCSIYMNNVFYVHAPERDGLFYLNLDHSTHIHSVDAKKCKLSDDIRLHVALPSGSCWQKAHAEAP